MLSRIKDPALPDYPQLRFDKKSSKAIVRGKLTNWKSYVAAGRGAAALLLLALGLMGLIAWDHFENQPSAERILYSFFAWLFMAGILSFAARVGLKPFLAKYVHSHPRIVIFTPKKIRIGWKSYGREHEGKPLQIEFRVNGDPEAERRSYAPNLDGPTRHILGSARKVEMVIRGSQLDSMLSAGQVAGPGRVVTVAELFGNEKAEQFSAVCRAALVLTAVEPDAAKAGPGRDLDAI